MSARFARLAVLAVALFLSFAGSAFAQITGAQLSGSVRDESGAAVKGATLTLQETSTDAKYYATSNDSGFYAIPNLPPGRYDLTVTFQGFATHIHKGIVLTVGQTATVDVVLKVATQTEQVTVTTEVPEIEPTKTEISQVINTQQIQDLPISGRQFTDFALLTAGVATGRTSLQSTITEFETTRISFAGMRDLSNMVTVDGADNINTATGSQRSTPPQESVQEFRVVNNAFGAEYGRALGGIVNIVTKSGTNDFHGSIYDYLQNNATDARSLLQPAPDAYVLRQNQFGAAAGGPIEKDKIFFFTNYEGQRRGESPTYPGVFYQNLDLINASKEALGIAPENLNILKTKNNDYGIAKIDYQLNANNHLSVRYNVEDGRDMNQLVGSTLDGGGIGAPSSGHNLFLRDQSLVGDLATTVKPDLVNSFLVQYARRHYNFPGVTGQPNLDIPNTLLFGHNFGVLDAIYESRVQATDSLAWVKGNHVAKFGADFNYINNFVIWPGFTPMRIVLPGLNCLVDFANYVNTTAAIPSNPADGPCPVAAPPYFPPTPGPNPYDPLNGSPIVFWGAPVGTIPNPPSGQLPTPPPIPTNWQNAYLPSEAVNFSETLNHSYYGFYAQDQWRLKPTLTLNYGLRYDFETGLSKQINPHYNGVQPRVGLAWSPDSKTVVRAGFGIFDDRYNLSFLFITQPQRPVIIPGETLPGIRAGANTATWVLNQLTPGPVGLPADAAKTLVLTGQVPDQFITGDCPPSCTAGAGMVQHNSKIPYSEQANLEIDRQLTNGLTVSAGYLWVSAHHLVRAENLNVCPPFGAAPGTTVPEVSPGTPGCGTPSNPAPEAPPSAWPTGKAFFYNGVNPSGTPAYPNAGLLYYTDNTGNSNYNGLTLQLTERFQKIFTLNANYTWSHTFDDGTFTTFVSTPQDLYDRKLEYANSNQDVRQRFVANFSIEGPKDSFLRNFTFSNIVTLQTPRPFTLFVGFDANGDTNPVTDRVGLSPRNSYYGDDLYSWDLRVARYFQFRERMRLDLMVDAFNALNRPNVDEVTSVYGAAVFCGATPKRYNDAATIAAQDAANAFDTGTGPPTCPLTGLGPVPAPPVPNNLFGAPRTMLNPRQFQFAAKFSF
ncbi:MAG: TonB-dependent receptor [Candidatus Acidiferrales bacterium]